MSDGPQSNRGRKPDELLAKLAVKFQGPDGKPSWKCIAPKCLHTAKGNFQQSRILKHSVSCKHLREYDRDAYDHAIRTAVGGSLGARREARRLEALETASSTIPAQVTGKPLTHASATTTGGSGNLISPDGTLNVATLRAEGAKRKSEQNEIFQDDVDLIIVRLICVRGLVPNIIDTPEWKELMQKLNGIYQPTSGDAFRDVHIPNEAAFVRDEQIKLLKKEENLTLTFDGMTTRKQESFYTAHATTPARDTYFLDGHEGSGEHHNTEWIVDKLLTVCLS